VADIETKNDLLVGRQGDNINILLAGVSLDRPAALRMAAYLVCLADDDDEFPAVLDAVRNT
jgi:hypothetical protein